MSRSRWCAISALILFALAPTASGSEAAQTPSLEHSIKATFLYKFAAFVQWPPSAFESAMTPIYICLMGSDPVTAALDELTITEVVDGRPYQIRRLDRVDRDSACHVLYVAGVDPQAASRAFEAVRGAPVLTVADASQLPQSQAIVTFVLDQNRVRFDIDDASAADSGLSISSRLLNLARAVRQRR